MPDLTERILAATLLDNLERSIADRLIDIHLRVVRDLLCPVTGKVLDSRTAHLIYIRIEDVTDEPVIAGVVHPETTSDELNERLTRSGVELAERFDPAEAWSTIR